MYSVKTIVPISFFSILLISANRVDNPALESLGAYKQDVTPSKTLAANTALSQQIMDRVGLRLSLGYNQGTIGAGEWFLNDRKQIADSPKSTIQGLTIRTMFYFGL